MSGYFNGRSGAVVVTVGVTDYVTYVIYVEDVTMLSSIVYPSHLRSEISE